MKYLKIGLFLFLLSNTSFGSWLNGNAGNQNLHLSYSGVIGVNCYFQVIGIANKTYGFDCTTASGKAMYAKLLSAEANGKSINAICLDVCNIDIGYVTGGTCAYPIINLETY